MSRGDPFLNIFLPVRQFKEPLLEKLSLNIMANQRDTNAPASSEIAPGHSDPIRDEVDLSLLEDSLAKSPWERMLANDDALRFADSLRAAMEKRNAKSKSTG